MFRALITATATGAAALCAGAGAVPAAAAPAVLPVPKPAIGVPAAGVPAIGVPTVGVPTAGVPAIGVPTIGPPTIGPPAIGLPAAGGPGAGVPVAGSGLGTTGGGAAPARKTALTLSYMAEAGFARAVVLTCNPPGGGHPRPVKACNTLSKVGGTPTGLKPARTMCMMIYAPITAQVSGRWMGTKIKWTKKYGNSCEMNRANGILFDF
jgi:hypothetical protein